MECERINYCSSIRDSGLSSCPWSMPYESYRGIAMFLYNDVSLRNDEPDKQRQAVAAKLVW